MISVPSANPILAVCRLSANSCDSAEKGTIMDVSREHIEIVQGAGGPKARIAGHNIRVEDVVGWHEGQGMLPAEIVEHFPTITQADVHAALAYYWDHKEELDRR